MLSRAGYEQQLLQEVKGLSGADIAKILKIVHVIKKEILEEKVENKKDAIMRYAGMLKGLKKEEQSAFDEAVRRRKLFGGRELEV